MQFQKDACIQVSSLQKDIAGDFNGDGKTDFIHINNVVQSSGAKPTIFNDTQFTVKTNVCGSFGQTKIVDFDRD